MRPVLLLVVAVLLAPPAVASHDSTPPEGTLTVTSSTHRPGTARPNPTTTAIFDWTAATDAQSPVTYRYGLSRGEWSALGNETSRLAAEVRVPSDGTWQFVVAACSHGGCGARASYTFAVGYATIDPEEIRELNDQVETTAVRRDAGDVVVRWRLPPASMFPTGSTIQGIDVVRLVCRAREACEPALAETLPGSLEDPEGEYVDEGPAEVMGYRIEVVFRTSQRQPPQVTGFTSIAEEEPASTSTTTSTAAATVTATGTTTATATATQDAKPAATGLPQGSPRTRTQSSPDLPPAVTVGLLLLGTLLRRPRHAEHGEGARLASARESWTGASRRRASRGKPGGKPQQAQPAPPRAAPRPLAPTGPADAACTDAI